VRFLVTRAEPDAQRTAAALRALGHAAVIAPLLRMEPVGDARIGAGPWAAILVTSANAAQAIARHGRVAHLRAVPVIAVGERSAQAMRAEGFADVTSADGNVGDLARLVAGRIAPRSTLLYLVGEDRAGDLAGDLGAHGFVVETAIVYRAAASRSLPEVAADTLANDVTGVLHFSRRSAAIYIELATRAGMLVHALRPVQFCLSAQVGEPLIRAGAATLRIAQRPTEAALLELIGPAP